MATIPLDKDFRGLVLVVRPDSQSVAPATKMGQREARRRHPSRYLHLVEDSTGTPAKPAEAAKLAEAKDRADVKNP